MALFQGALSYILAGTLSFVFSLVTAQPVQLPYNYTCPQLWFKPCQCATIDQYNIHQIQVHCEVLAIRPDYLDFSVIQSDHTTVLYLVCNDIFNSQLYDRALEHLTWLEELALISCKLNRIKPESFIGLQNLHVLNISSVPEQPKVIIDPNSFQHMPSIELINLPNLNIVQLPHGVFCGLKELKYIDLTSNLLTDWKWLTYANVANYRQNICLPELATLGLGGNRLSSLTESLVLYIPKIIGLFLNYNNLLYIENYVFHNLTHLLYLDISYNKLTNLPDGIFKNLQNLKTINVESNLINCLPLDIFSHTINVNILNLGHNLITTNCLPILNQMKQLQEINFSFNKLDLVLNTTFDGLINLAVVHLEGNNLDAIHWEIFNKFHNLQNLNISHNSLKSLANNSVPSIIDNQSTLWKLKILDISSNEITDTNIRTITYTQIPNVQNLYLPNNLLTRIPNQPDIILRNLVLLDLNYNQLVEINNLDFTSFSSLQYLLLKGNSITYVPKHGFISMQGIVLINLSYNSIYVLEYQAFNNLPNLQFLSLNHNHLTDIDLVFNFIPTLKVLYINNNNITRLKNEYLSNSLNSIDVSHNNIREFELVLLQLRYLTDFDISFNKLRKVSKSALMLNVVPGYQRPVLKLAANYMFCDCNMQYLQTINKNVLGNINYPIITDVNSILCKTLTHGTMSNFLIDLNSKDFLCEYCPINVQHCESAHGFCPLFGCPCCKNTYSNNCTCLQDCPDRCLCAVSADRNYHEIDCSNKKMSKVPQQPLTHATHIYMDGNNFKTIEQKDFEYDKEVQHLYLNNSNIDYVKSYSFRNLTSLISLYLHNNKIKHLNNFTFYGLVNLKTLSLRNNCIESIAINALAGLENLNILYLDNNNLTKIDSDSFHHIPKAKEIYLANNYWICDCTFGPPLQNWIVSNAQYVKDDPECNVLEQALINNGSDYQITGTNFDPCKNLSTERIIHKPSKALLPITLGLSITFLAITIVICLTYKYKTFIQIWLFTRFGIRFSREKEDSDKEYDAFVSYSSNDERFVVRELMTKLEEGDPPYRLCLHYRDWIVGYGIAESVISSVHSSRRTILLLSKAFIQSEWCNYEFQTAHHQVLKDKTCRLVIVLLEDEEPEGMSEELQLYIKSHTYIRKSDPWFWERLRYALPHVSENQKIIHLEAKRKEKEMIQRTKEAMIQLNITDIHGINI